MALLVLGSSTVVVAVGRHQKDLIQRNLLWRNLLQKNRQLHDVCGRKLHQHGTAPTGGPPGAPLSSVNPPYS